MPENSKTLNFKSSSIRESQQQKKEKDAYNELWFCCNCDVYGPPGILLWQEHCPQCATLRCEECPRDVVKFRRSFNRKIAACPSVLIDAVSSPIRQASKSWESSKTINPNTDPFSRSLIPDTLSVSPTTVEQKSTSSSATPTANSSPQSSERTSNFMDENPSPDTDIDIFESSDSSDEDIEIGSDNAQEMQLMEAIDECILTACIDNLQLADAAIPEVHRALATFAHNDRNHAAGGTHSGSIAGNEHGSSGSSSQGSPGNLGKRGCENGQSSGRPEKQQKQIVGDGAEDASSPGKLHKFACHFCKRDPMKYNFRANKKYKNCPHPSIPDTDLRRIKDHFKKAHCVSQCDRCYVIFKDKDTLVNHRQMPDPCAKQPSILKEGIDDGQWEKIENILRENTKNEKSRPKSQKWYDIWEVLFCGVEQPRTPYNEPVDLSMSTSSDRYAIMREITAGVENRIEQGFLPRSDQLYQEIFGIIRSVLSIDTSEAETTMITAAESELKAHDGSSEQQGRSGHAPWENLDAISTAPASDLPRNNGAASFYSFDLINPGESNEPEPNFTEISDTASEGWPNMDGMDDGILDVDTFLADLQNPNTKLIPLLSWKSRTKELVLT